MLCCCDVLNAVHFDALVVLYCARYCRYYVLLCHAILRIRCTCCAFAVQRSVVLRSAVLYALCCADLHFDCYTEN